MTSVLLMLPTIVAALLTGFNDQIQALVAAHPIIVTIAAMVNTIAAAFAAPPIKK